VTTLPAPTNAVDLKGLDQLRRRAANDDPKALAEVAVQFEALFIGMMLDSARNANGGGGLFDSPQTQQYLELMDRQVALDLARRGGLGFGTMLLEQLAPREASGAAVTSAAARNEAVAPRLPLPQPRSDAAAGEFPTGLPPSLEALGIGATTTARSAAQGVDSPPANSPSAEDFVAKLLPEASAAAAALGIEPRLLLAQAALETGWGGAVPQRPDGASAHNLFGIKAGDSWRGARISQWTIEHEGGVAERKREQFRGYASTAASFADYVDLIANTPRYANALASTKDPEAYARAVTAAGYATDPEYADKWLAIYRGDRLDGALRNLDGTPPGHSGD
jgi:flagellar protein FlgJ